MTLFLHIPELKEGIQAAQNVLSNEPDDDQDVELRIINSLGKMLDFAQRNVSEMLGIMGFQTIDELNAALHNYNNLNLSLRQIFPAFSEPMMTEALARSGIGNATAEGDYGLFISAFEDSLRRRYEQYFDEQFAKPERQEELRALLQNEGVQQNIAADIILQLFTGQEASLGTGLIDFGNGRADFSQVLSKLMGIANKAVKMRGAVTTNSRTYMTVYNNIIMPFLKRVSESDWQIFLNEEGPKQLEDKLKLIVGDSVSREIIRERILRGGITSSINTGVKSKQTADGVQLTAYIDKLQIGIDRSAFDLKNRPIVDGKKQSIENYVNEKCKQYPEFKDQILKNAKEFYWKQITDYLPHNVTSPILQSELDKIIDDIGESNIGWLFSQGTTKAGGAGMFGEIAGMIYLSILCPKLKENYKAIWAGGTQSDSNVKPPADIILSDALHQYGIQVKNYTSGTTLSHDYALRIQDELDALAKKTVDQDFMVKQITQELNISEAEVEAVQNVIIANTFNVPYAKVGDHFEQVGNVPVFNGIRAMLTETYNKATKYMALISVIMHRVQYAEEIDRWVTSTKFEEKQLQNTLWLVNGNLFVSSVQILSELIEYVKKAMNNFFSVSASVRVSKKSKNEVLPEGLQEGGMTIVEYYNYNTEALRRSALSHITARITTNYKMSAFNP